jgi:hypothetical protein
MGRPPDVFRSASHVARKPWRQQDDVYASLVVVRDVPSAKLAHPAKLAHFFLRSLTEWLPRTL